MKLQHHDTTRATKLAYSYRRFSSKNQAGNTSLERQLSMAKEVCLEKGWQLIDLPPDEGVSAFKITNEAEQTAANFHKGTLGQFLKKVRRGEIVKGSVLILERLDRFSRNFFDLVYPVWLELLQSGVEIYNCVSRTHYTIDEIRKTPFLAAAALMELATANDYSRNMGGRIAKAFTSTLAKCQAGEKIKLGPWQPRWIEFKGGVFSFNEHGDTMKRIISEYIGGRSMWGIAKGLTADNVPTMLGGKWSQQSIKTFLHHKALMGDMTFKGTLLKGYYPPLASENQFQRLQAKLRENSNRKGGSGTSEYIANLFRNRCTCVHCGGTVNTTKSHVQRHYVCKNRRLGGCQCRNTINVAALELDFFVGYLQQSPSALLKSNDTEHSEKIAKINSELAGLDSTVAKIVALMDTLPLAELKLRLATLENQRTELKAELDRLNSSIISSQAAPAALSGVQHFIGADIVDIEGGKKALDERVKIHLGLRSTRRHLLNLLPSIVKQLCIDTTAKKYQIETVGGVKSEWRKL
jgi:DNA invertase Pin-like site-specific DNA recombinase